MPTLLLIEADRSCCHWVRDALEPEQFIVIDVPQGRQGLEFLSDHAVDVILLNLPLPAVSGLALIRAMRALSAAPLIIIAPAPAEQTQIDCYAAGADDYVVAPFSGPVMIARLQAHLRRSHHGQIHQDNTATLLDLAQQVRFGAWVLDRRRYQLFDAQSRPGNLTLREFQLLEKLVAHPDQVMRRDELCAILREELYAPTPRAIDVKITRIRRKIGDHAINPTIIKTVRGAGYMFNGATLVTPPLPLRS